jgi:hypothetical protein
MFGEVRSTEVCDLLALDIRHDGSTGTRMPSGARDSSRGSETQRDRDRHQQGRHDLKRPSVGSSDRRRV